MFNEPKYTVCKRSHFRATLQPVSYVNIIGYTGLSLFLSWFLSILAFLYVCFVGFFEWQFSSDKN